MITIARKRKYPSGVVPTATLCDQLDRAQRAREALKSAANTEARDSIEALSRQIRTLERDVARRSTLTSVR